MRDGKIYLANRIVKIKKAEVFVQPSTQGEHAKVKSKLVDKKNFYTFSFVY